jgi:signal transduction histidine kinase
MNQAKIATERREIELAALEKNFEAKNAFFSNISHDMRTPLNAILNFTRLAREKGLAAPKAGRISGQGRNFRQPASGSD